ncbi:hypothetical protein SAMN05421821_105130 [Mucilaginibacter lappiensis]|uniref:Phage tail protein n=1 Tax=Mucilaginibacter lappiensis TaxID=354630 RepID=A0ABR6PIV5_9SPHI|nr:hypothetical protein [Mucilaginibacter lappiensis]MBB6109712.1 hypothetical protein [Mucilaginibacter lappiensis]SIR12764.1 hypothetical protein SAMN05421821_105130 [Mucilaginibacter lappiensis]
MSTFVVGGIEKIEYAPASLTGVILPAAWKPMPNIAVGSVKMTKNIGSKTSIKQEDGNKTFLNVFQPADGDTLTIGLLEQNPDLVKELFDVDFTAATTTTEYYAGEKIAHLAIRITTVPMKDSRKCIITIYNNDVQTGYDNNITSDAVEQLALTANIGSYRKAGDTKDKVYTKQFVNADGTVIDSTPAG